MTWYKKIADLKPGFIRFPVAVLLKEKISLTVINGKQL
jgi:hypothetical protein